MIARILAPFLPYIAGVALLAALGAAGVIWWQSGTIDTLRGDVARLELLLGGCEARAANITKDKESDREIDNIPDDGLRNAPPGWMLQPGDGGIY